MGGWINSVQLGENGVTVNDPAASWTRYSLCLWRIGIAIGVYMVILVGVVWVFCVMATRFDFQLKDSEFLCNQSHFLLWSFHVQGTVTHGLKT
jgi:hypothetical protein